VMFRTTPARLSRFLDTNSGPFPALSLENFLALFVRARLDSQLFTPSARASGFLERTKAFRLISISVSGGKTLATFFLSAFFPSSS